MSHMPISAPIDELVLECHRCGARASVRAGKDYLCTRCAVEAEQHEALTTCDLCDRESLVRLGEQFLCGSCAMAVLRESAKEFETATMFSVELGTALSGGEGSALARELEIGTLVRGGQVRLADAAAAHHQILARSIRRARDPEECVRRVEAAALFFNVWAFSFDARLEELERTNETLARIVRQSGLARSPSLGRT
jgi:hypothetical protein